MLAVKFDVSHFSTYCQESPRARQFRVPGLFIAQISFTNTTQISFSSYFSIRNLRALKYSTLLLIQFFLIQDFPLERFMFMLYWKFWIYYNGTLSRRYFLIQTQHLHLGPYNIGYKWEGGMCTTAHCIISAKMFCIFAKKMHLFKNHFCICTETILVFVPRRGREGGADCTISANFPQPWAPEYQYGNQICISDVFFWVHFSWRSCKGSMYLMFATFLSERSMLQLAHLQVSKLQRYRHSWI